jgi:hypothetical protein
VGGRVRGQREGWCERERVAMGVAMALWLVRATNAHYRLT